MTSADQSSWEPVRKVRTYEQVMAARIHQRCEMMRVLLGAGQWLDQDREVKELDHYRMTFPA